VTRKQRIRLVEKNLRELFARGEDGPPPRIVLTDVEWLAAATKIVDALDNGAQA
jgi:hypothetical protein